MTASPTEIQSGRFETRAGRKAPFTMVGDWVTLADTPPPRTRPADCPAGMLHREAKLLYEVLLAHAAMGRDDDVDASRGTLAELLGYEQARAVDPYVEQLEAFGAIEVQRGAGYRGCNVYVVHQEPPEDFTGIRSYAAWYRRRKERAKERARQARDQGER